jgi:O-succinylbenzoate synthase
MASLPLHNALKHHRAIGWGELSPLGNFSQRTPTALADFMIVQSTDFDAGRVT